MKILSITAGAAGMYCGSCFRDNALAAELLRRGHDVTLMPMYTPTRTDEPNVSAQDRVLFGGISVYLQQRYAIFRHTPRLFDWLIDAPPVIRALSSRSVSTSPTVLGELTISMLRGRDGVLQREFDKLATWMAHEPLPDVINLPNSMLIALAAPLRAATGRPIVCTLQGEELFLDGLVPPYRDEALRLIRAQVPEVDRFVAVSEYCARFMSGYLSIPADRISVVPLGIDFAGYERHVPGSGRPVLGYFARIAPEKGLKVLAQAFVELRRRLGAAAPTLEAAGYPAPADRPYLDDVRRLLASAGCADDFTYHGELDRAGKLAFLRRLDVLSVPATYDEPKGMFLLEAMACGVPVVQPRRGAFTEIVERTGGGLLVDLSSQDLTPTGLADAIHRVLTDRALAAELGQRAFDGVRAHYGIGSSAAKLLDVYAGVMAGRS